VRFNTLTINLAEYLADFKVIAGISDDSKLEKALYSRVKAVFLLNARLNALTSYAERCREHKKKLFLHLDLMEGMKSDQEAIRYLSLNELCDGIITTHRYLIESAKKEDLLTIQRIFVLDSGTIKKGIKGLKKVRPDAVEILPGLMAPYFINELSTEMDIPFIAGGLIRKKEEVKSLIKKGLVAVSTGEDLLWY